MDPRATRYVPALGYRALTRLYDPVLRWALKEHRFKSLLVREVGLRPGHRALDLGCGTGSLTVMLQKACPGARVFGLDVDRAALEIARRKADGIGLALSFQRGTAEDPPFAGQSFDRVVSSLLFHHLPSDAKLRALRAVRALLTDGGELHVADWGEARSIAMRFAFLGVQLLDGFASTAANVRGLLPGMMQEAGLTDVTETHRERTIFGTLSLYHAQTPVSPAARPSRT